MKFSNLIYMLGIFPALLSAEIILETPKNAETISTTDPLLRAFLQKPHDERREYFNDQKNRAALHKVRDAQPYSFTWRCTDGEKGPFTVTISEAADFSLTSPAFVIPPKDVNSCERKIANFLIGRKYFWKVEGKSKNGTVATSKSGTFKTDSSAPRLLIIPNVGNVRDLGGRRGLDGKMLRQGMIFRSAGLNHNSPDFHWDRKKWLKENVEEFRVGKTKLTPESVDYINNVLKWKTDLDLRSQPEVGTMKESPAGPNVRWIHLPGTGYGGLFVKSRTSWVASDFRVFCNRANYPIDFHCIGGADRGGSLAYLLKGILGVEKDELEKDWENTANDYFVYEKMLDQIVKGFEKFGQPTDPWHKKIEAYLLSIGITPQEIAEFRSIMLE